MVSRTDASTSWADQPRGAERSPVLKLLYVAVHGREGTASYLKRTLAEFYDFEHRLEEAVGEKGLVQVKASSFEFTLRAEVPDADALWSRCDPLLRAGGFGDGGFVLRRYGPPGAREVQVAL